MDTTTIQETGTTIIQYIPEEYQPMAATIFGIVLSIIGFYFATKPIFDTWRNNKQIAAINANALTTENVQLAVDKGMKEYKLLAAKKELVNWQYKLSLARTDEAIQMCNVEIAKLEAEIITYA